MAKIKLKAKAKTLTAKQKADALKKAKAEAKKKKLLAEKRKGSPARREPNPEGVALMRKFGYVPKTGKTVKATTKPKTKAKPKGEGRAVGKDVQKKQQESNMATPVGKGRISESVKGRLGTRTATPSALLRRRSKSAEDKRRDAILSSKGEKTTELKEAMKETRKIEAPRRALNTLRSRVEKLRRKANKTTAEKAQLKKLVARLNKMESRREAMIQAGRSGSAKVSLAGPKGKIQIDTRKIKRRMSKGGKV